MSAGLAFYYLPIWLCSVEIINRGGFAQLFVNFNSHNLLFAFLERAVNEIHGIV